MHDFAVRVATRGGKMTQEPLCPEGHPKRIEQDSQTANPSAPSSSRKKKKKNDRTLHASSKPEIDKPPDNENETSISDAETERIEMDLEGGVNRYNYKFYLLLSNFRQ